MTTVAELRVHDLIAEGRGRGATDVHLAGGAPPAMRIDGRLVAAGGAAIASPALRAFASAALTAQQLARLDALGTADGAAPCRAPGAPYRLHAYRHGGELRLAIRLLAETIPALDALGLPAAVARLTDRRAGLVLFAGPTGSGKTTALAAALDRINRGSERVIVTVEDPIEYVHVPLRSIVAQCEIGRDVLDHEEALRGFVRADPDVIALGEMRDVATMAAALRAAETGHLVFSTVHTGDAALTIDRIVDAFAPPAQHEIRAQLAATLAAVVALRLVPRRTGPGRCCAAEVLVATDAVRALVRDGKSHQLRNAILTGRESGMQTLEAHLSELVMRGTVSLPAARAATDRPGEIAEAAP